jgi:hypothetical protein
MPVGRSTEKYSLISSREKRQKRCAAELIVHKQGY